MSDFRNSKTKDNLMRAFAGESQARNRYTMAEEKARQQKLYVLADLFKFTADQEKVHAKIFYEHLKELSGESVFVDGGYPVDISEDVYLAWYGRPQRASGIRRRLSCIC